MKKPGIIVGVIVLVIVACGAYAGWWFVTSPQYSLMQMKKAVEQRDAASFQQYVDIEGIIRRAGNQLSAQWTTDLTKKISHELGFEPEMLGSLTAAFGSSLIEPTVKQVREAILSFLETGRAVPIQALPGDAIDLASEVSLARMPKVERQGKMATINLELAVAGEPVRARLFMRNLGRFWQIAEIDQVAETAQMLLAAYATGERKRISRERTAHPDRTVALPGLPQEAEPLKLCYIPAGKFMMGSPDNEENRGKNEGPRHKVAITKPFWMGRCEVTNGQFEAFVKETNYVTDAEKGGNGLGWDVTTNQFGMVKGANWRDPKLPFATPASPPVVQVSWNDATAFCEWLSKKTGEKCGLPTEAQWEYACRAGTSGKYYWGNSDGDACAYANVFNQVNKGKFNMNGDAFPCDDGFAGLAPIGHFKPNAFGLYDMIGNVFEWCADWYSDTYYASSPAADPPGPSEGQLRVVRGGSWGLEPSYCRAAARSLAASLTFVTPVAGNWSYSLGFRVLFLSEAAN